jgi:PHB accumulation regulatory protein
VKCDKESHNRNGLFSANLSTDLGVCFGGWLTTTNDAAIVPRMTFPYFRGNEWSERMREPISVKRYAGSRFYDTVHARYVTLDDLREWRERGIAFTVRDAETGEDVSRVLLA